MADQDNKTNQVSEVTTPNESDQKKVEESALELSHDSQNLLREFDQAGLEVAAMPESNELQERRRKTKNRLRELSEVNEEENGEGNGQTFENDEGGLMDLLKEANLSKRQVGFCCGGVLLIVVLAGLVYGGIKLWNNWDGFDFGGGETDEIPVEPSEPSVSDYADPTIVAGLMLGQGSSGTDSSTDLGESIGTASSSQDELTQLIVDFTKIYEAMQVDVNELLDQATNREKALADYQDELKYLLYVGRQNVERLNEESDELVRQYEGLEDQRDTQESLFFDQLRHLDAYASSATLNTFVADGQAVVKLRAHYHARQKLLEYYEQILENMETRVTDIQLNEEALIQGIQVVDIQGSDLNLIIDESEL